MKNKTASLRKCHRNAATESTARNEGTNKLSDEVMNNLNISHVRPSAAETLICWRDIRFSASSAGLDREPPDHQSEKATATGSRGGR
jgi:hypothetical protein